MRFKKTNQSLMKGNAIKEYSCCYL